VTPAKLTRHLDLDAVIDLVGDVMLFEFNAEIDDIVISTVLRCPNAVMLVCSLVNKASATETRIYASAGRPTRFTWSHCIGGRYRSFTLVLFVITVNNLR